MLTVTGLSAAYSGIKALRSASLTVHEGEFVALIGPNGAGKSTLLNCLSGVVRPTGGSIRFMGQELVGMAPWNVSRKGLLQVPEGRQVLPNLSVREKPHAGGHGAVRSCFHPHAGAYPRVVPDPGRAPRAACRFAQRRSAADAGDRARTHGRTAPAAARRNQAWVWPR